MNIAEKKAKKRLLEEEGLHRIKDFKEMIKGVEEEVKMEERKVEETKIEKETSPEFKLREQLPALKPEKVLEVHEEAERIKTAHHTTPEEVRRDETLLETKVIELKERELEERLGRGMIEKETKKEGLEKKRTYHAAEEQLKRRVKIQKAIHETGRKEEERVKRAHVLRERIRVTRQKLAEKRKKVEKELMERSIVTNITIKINSLFKSLKRKFRIMWGKLFGVK